MWIMIAGPYTYGTPAPEGRAANLRALNRAALEVFAMGHVPLIGVNMALPMIEAAEEGSYERIMMPLSLSLVDRCDACLRIGGASPRADQEADRFRQLGRPVFSSLDELRAALPEHDRG